METGEQEANVKLWKFPTLEEAEKEHPIEAGAAASGKAGTGSAVGSGSSAKTTEATSSSVDANEVLGAHVRKWTFPTLDDADKNS